MLIRDDLARLPHFVNHPEMLPFSGYNGILIVGECANLTDKFFADKADKFLNWYDEPTPKYFEGLTEAEWRLTKVQYNIQQTFMRNYDKYANPQPQRLFYEISELFGKIVTKKAISHVCYPHMYSRIHSSHTGDHINAAAMYLESFLKEDAKGRWRGCSYYTYYQRPNLTEGTFQTIMPGEDEKAFEIFCEIIENMRPHLIIVLSAKVSESIKIQSGNKLPKNVHFFDSPYPSQWTAQARMEFTNIIEEMTCKWLEGYILDWLDVTDNGDDYFIKTIEDVIFEEKYHKINPLQGLDNLIASNAKYIFQCNPLNFKNYKESFVLYKRKPRLLDKFKPIPWFNAYPLNVETDKVFPLFLAICRGDESLDTILKKIDEQCQKMIEGITSNYPKDMLIKKNVVLLTDKWDKEIFRKYRNKFYDYKNNGIHFTFSLIKENSTKSIDLG